MNTKKTSGFRGFGIYIIFILAVIIIWYIMSRSNTTTSYTKEKLMEAIEAGNVNKIEVVQNREVPTGSLEITLSSGTTEVLYVSDVNAIQEELEDADFTNYIVDEVPAESWLMTLLPYLLIFSARRRPLKNSGSRRRSSMR